MKYLIIVLTVLLSASFYVLEVSKAYATSIEIHEIIFEDHDGEIIYREYVAAGADLTNFILPDVNSRGGYLFMGWSAELPEVMPNADLVIVAQYMIAELRVTATI